MRYQQISEAVIKVPNSFLSVINKYVSSVLATQLNNSLSQVKVISDRTQKPELYTNREEEIKKVISMLNQRYGAVILNDSTYQSIISSPVKLNFNAEQFISELTMKVTPEIQAALQKSVYLKVQKYGGATRGELNVISTGDCTVVISADAETSPLDPNIYARVKDVMSTVYHESQHYVQHVAIRQINSNDKQLQRSSNVTDQSSSDDFDEYLSSYIEFGPTLGNFIDKIETTLEIMKANGTLGDDKYSTIFKKVLDEAVKKDEKYRAFLIALYKKSPDRYKLALKKLYTMTFKSFELIKNADDVEVLADLPYGEVPIDINPMQTAYDKLKTDYELKAYSKNGQISRLYKITIKINPETNFSIETSDSENFNVTLLADSVHEEATINPGQVLSLVSSLMFRKVSDAWAAYSIIMGIERDTEFSTDSVQVVLKDSYNTCKYNNVPSEITTDSILIGSITFEIDVEDDQYVIISPDVQVWLSARTTSKLQRNMNDLIYATKNSSSEEVLQCIKDNHSGYDLVQGLRNL